jgi:hypothetical protein
MQLGRLTVTTTFSIMTLSIKGLLETLSITELHAVPLCWVLWCWLSRFIYYYAECHYAECRGAALGLRQHCFPVSKSWNRFEIGPCHRTFFPKKMKLPDYSAHDHHFKFKRNLPTVRTLNSSPSLHSAKTHIPRSISNSHSTLARLLILIYSKRVFILGYLCCRVIGLKSDLKVLLT